MYIYIYIYIYSIYVYRHVVLVNYSIASVCLMCLLPFVYTMVRCHQPINSVKCQMDSDGHMSHTTSAGVRFSVQQVSDLLSDYTYIYIYTHTYVYVWVYVYTHTSLSLSIYIYIYVHTHIQHTYIYIYIYIYIHIHRFSVE